MGNIIIRGIRANEWSLIKHFPPDDWNLDLEDLYRRHSVFKCFHAVVAICKNEIAGTGMVLVNGNFAWLGTIIVKDSFRNMGIGTSITKELIRFAEEKKCEGVILIATESGYHVYNKIGFKSAINYIIFEKGRISIEPENEHISKINKRDHDRIFNMDKLASGETRMELLSAYLVSGYKYSAGNEITGYYLPDFGKGLVIAIDKKAGIELLRFKLLNHTNTVVIPDQNTDAIEFVKSEGFIETNRLRRMFLYKEAEWHPEMIYSRGSGYCG